MTDNTNKCINKIKNKMGKMEQKLDDIEEKIDDAPTEEGMKLAIEKAVDRVLSKADDKYANKSSYQRTEKIVNALVIGIFTLGLAITITVLFGQQLPIEVGL